jgi:hypothetical protein
MTQRQWEVGQHLGRCLLRRCLYFVSDHDKNRRHLSNIPEVKLYANRSIPQPTVQVKTYKPSTSYVHFVHIERTGAAKTLHIILNICVNATDNIQGQNCPYLSTHPTLIYSYPDSGDETNAILYG